MSGASSSPPEPFAVAPAEPPPSTRALARAAAYALVVGTLLRICDAVLALARPKVLLAYLKLWRTSFRSSPYREKSYAKVAAARKVARSVGELTYGETPLCTGVVMLLSAGLPRGARVVDPLAGRGRFLLAARLLGCQARGLELVEENVFYATAPLARAGVALEHADATDADFSDADLVYLCWTCLAPSTRDAVAARLSTLKKGAKVLCVTWPVDEGFEQLWSRRYLFTWGRADVSLHVRT